MPAKVYTDKDADLAHLQNKRCAIIGFGSQGHAHALNLKDSGVGVVIGLYRNSKSIPAAQEYGFEVKPVADAVEAADVILFATPDLRTPSIYENEVAPKLTDGKAL
ncbi:MAG: NAD(P)-binding domain-containing protein, partial [Verrucomicrobia bacterium]|nr:NAD(P)-binding domain-containing protein [Verrucomicrobiota bacterium]